jgi:thiosulfate reductase/polysulfide reductase chain A
LLPGSLPVSNPRCGKPGCHCAEPHDPGHPIWTATARFSDERHPIRPGSDLAAALAVINMLLEEYLYNRKFVHQYTNFIEYEGEIRGHFKPYTLNGPRRRATSPRLTSGESPASGARPGPASCRSTRRSRGADYANATQTCHALSALNMLAGDNFAGSGAMMDAAVQIEPA